MVSENEFKLTSKYQPSGDQPEAIRQLVKGYKGNAEKQVLLGVTGSGKTFTMANVIQELGVPTLIIAHNKTLAAQLYGEFMKFFPENAVEYFVSYYDYFQPEAYIPTTDSYIEKDSKINENIDRMRHKATRSLLERRDVIIIASVSCIYGLGSPEAYYGMLVSVEVGQERSMENIIAKLVEIQYERNEFHFKRGTFRVRGDVLEVFPAHEETVGYRLEFFGDEIENLVEFDSLTGKVLKYRTKIAIYPTTHYVTADTINKEEVYTMIRQQLKERTEQLHELGKLVEEQRLTQRTLYDIEMIKETGYCKGIENYSAIFENRTPGEPPPTLLSYLPKDALVIIDESHITMPQIRGMYGGDRSRKTMLVEYGFRLPCALDNRPLRFEEFMARVNRVMYVSATPAEFEIKDSEGVIVEQIIRPTGLIDPPIEIRPARTQVDDLLGEIHNSIEKGNRVLVTTLTKRMAEEITNHYSELGIRCKYMHSDIDTLERIRLIKELRLGEYDMLIGINLLREGLDIPEVDLIAIFDADKEGFLRSDKSLIQTVGRAARNAHAKAIFYADRMTDSMQRAINETERRRNRQIEYNELHNITPQTVINEINDILSTIYEKDYMEIDVNDSIFEFSGNRQKDIQLLEKLMYEAAKNREYEKASKYKDILFELQSK